MLLNCHFKKLSSIVEQNDVFWHVGDVHTLLTQESHLSIHLRTLAARAPRGTCGDTHNAGRTSGKLRMTQARIFSRQINTR